jgi:hypothetical protein
MPDGRLLKSIAYGDRHAFDELYRRYYRPAAMYRAPSQAVTQIRPGHGIKLARRESSCV